MRSEGPQLLIHRSKCAGAASLYYVYPERAIYTKKIILGHSFMAHVKQFAGD
jgi:hypothetical protein